MSNDRELLELAAKAAGLRVKHVIENMDDQIIGLCVKIDGLPKFDWNPLTDDGDALRLAVKLDLDILFRQVGGKRIEIIPPNSKPTCEEYEIDISAATRRAIVRAAAEIGKAMS